MLPAILFLFGFQLLGTALMHGFALPVPGPVAGLVLLLGWVAAGGPVPERLSAVVTGLLTLLPVLFVPAATGVVQHLPVVEAFGLKLLAIIVVSTLVGLITTTYLFCKLARRWAPPRDEELRQS